MNRRTDWLDRLWAEIESTAAAREPFDYGSHDCCLFVARCVERMTDTPMVDPLLGRYHDRRTALQFIAVEGGLVEAVSTFLGDPEQGFPRRGDVLLVETADGPGVGICIGSEVVIAADPGVTYQPARGGTVWRIG